MDKDEARVNEEIDEKNFKTPKEGTDWDNNIVISHAADTEAYSDKSDNVGSDVVLEGADIVDDDFFEHVSLKDSAKNEEDVNQYTSPNKSRHSSTGSDNVFDFSFAHARSSGVDSPQDAEGPDNIYFSSTGPGDRDSDFDMDASPSASLDSVVHLHGDFRYSPVESPQKSKPKQAMPNVSPELLHLVDSAIMGKPESLEKLKNVVSGVESFGGHGEAVAVSYLVVDSLLATMGGVESFEEDEDDNPPSVMLNSRAAIVAGGLIPWLPDFGDFQGLMSPRTRMKKSGWNPSLLLHSYLAGHSLSPSDLHKWLHVITRTLTTVWAACLLHSLEKAMSGKEVRGPASTFEFDGESSGLLGPGESKWPFTNGYAFATWIYIESFADNISTATTAAAIAMAAAATSGKSSPMSAAAAASALAGEGTAHMPRLFSFLSADNQGMEAYFHAQFLVVECGSGKGRKASLHFTHAFKPQCWYFVGLEHTCKQGLLGKSESEMRLYIDGSLYESRPFDFPRISKPLAFCCIGTNPPPTMAGLQRRRRQCPLFAEMGPVYIFKEPIGPEKMARLAYRGGDVLPSFGSGAGSPWLATNDHVQNVARDSALLDVETAGSIHLLYHPNLLNGRYCPDASPYGAAGMLRRPAEVLGQVHVATRMRPTESLWALAHGGPISLLPFAVSSVHENSLEPQCSDLSLSLATTALAAPIFRIMSLAIRHPGNNEELCLRRGPEILSRILNYLLQTLSSIDAAKHDGVSDEELVAAIVSLCQSQKFNHMLKVQLFSNLLLDLKIWSLCSYGLQKKLLSSLADMVFTEASVMRDANAIQMLLDGCRRCYWTVFESDSVNTFSVNEDTRLVGEVNALVDELLVVVELLVVAAPPSLAAEDVHCLLGFMVDCPQPNQVARVLHLMYRLVVQPNKSRAQTFAEAFISFGGIETLLVLLQREAKAGDQAAAVYSIKQGEAVSSSKTDTDIREGISENSEHGYAGYMEQNDSIIHDNASELECFPGPMVSNISRMSSISENPFTKNLGGISFSISAENARNNVYNVDKGDGIVVGIINLIGALVIAGHLKFDAPAPTNVSKNIVGLLEGGGTMFDDKVSLLLFGLQKAFQAAPHRLMTNSVYTALLAASINASLNDDGLNFHDSGHRFEHFQLLLVLLRSLPYASTAFQSRALQDLLILSCGHPENRNNLTKMDEWPEWILEILISNHENGSSKSTNPSELKDVEDFIHNFLIIMLEHSMRQKDGWKDIEATIHCAEWLSMVGGCSTGDLRIRREESLPIFKRRLLGSLLDFAARELQDQTQVIATAAAGVAAEGLSPRNAKMEAENAAQLSVALVENAIVILMLVEDHLRLQSKLYCASCVPTTSASPLPNVPVGNQASSTANGETLDPVFSRNSSSSDAGGLSLDVLASMADANGQISTTVMERLAAAAAAEPYESVSCAFVSYGSCFMDLAEGWKYRSQLWYGVGLPLKTSGCGGGGSGWESWKSALEKDSDGNWIELPLINKSVTMLQALLLDDSGLGGGLGIGGGSGTGMGGMSVLYQLLDSDQPFLCMLRMVLVSLREDDTGGDHVLMRHLTVADRSPKGFDCQTSSATSFDTKSRFSTRKPRSSLLWRKLTQVSMYSVLSPVLNMPISESKRQRVLVASCVIYSEVWHAIGKDRNPLRKHYLEAILPPFVAVLRRWRPLLAGIHELATADGINPLVVDDRALAADSLPVEAALAMISPSWAASFASPPAAMALAMIAAGAAGSENNTPPTTSQLRRDSSLLERKTTRLHTFSSFQKPLETTNKFSVVPKDKAAAKAAALAAARDLERNAKIGSGRGLSAVAMATSAQRRSRTDADRVKRWSASEAMGTAWAECLQSVDSKSVYAKDLNALSYKYIAVLVGSLALARNMQRSEVDRRSQVDMIAQHRTYTGKREWRKLIHCLIEIKCLFGPFSDDLCSPQRVVYWKLDSMESSSRMRRILRRNYQGSDHFGAAANYEDRIDQKHETQKVISPSKASILAAEAISTEVGIEEDEHDAFYLDGSPNGEFQKTSGSGEQMFSESREPPMTNDLDTAPVSSAVTPGYVPSEHDERIVLELPSSMVRPLKVLTGTFQITSRRINFLVDHMDNAAMDDVNCKGLNEVQEKDQSWLISSLHQVYSRRYLLRRSALELFMVDRSNYFFDFGNTEGRRDAYRAIVQARPPHLNNIYLATQRPEQLLKRTQLMERWARWELSNFEYLMQLNTLAGRSYNDITQYPVFPWILSDYSSPSLDLSNPSSYRDLSKPVGALNEERLQKFQERYSSFDDPLIPKFHYGSHYSTAGTVPELFYLPEILTNENSIDFGTTQLGEKLGPVRLPQWAENPVDFIHKHRMALESEHVSAHLHEWIDLIFGYKQRGKEAIQASNVFFYITYEGAVDIDKISDPVQQRSTQDQIAYFGQTPSQLLTVPHVKRMELADALHVQTIFRNPRDVKPYVVPYPERCNLPASAIHASSDSLIIVDTSAPAAHIAQHKWQPNTPDGHGTPFLFHHGRPGGVAGGGAFIRMFKGPTASGSEESHFPQALAFPTPGIQSSAIVAITCDGEIITGGHVDNSVRLISADGAKTIEIARGHCAPVTCLDISSDSSYLVTGSRDSTVLLWRIHRASSSRSSTSQEPSTNPGTPKSPGARAAANNLAENIKGHHIQGPIHVLRGHRGEITCCSVSSDLGIVASCSKSSDLLIHSIRRGRLVRRLVGVEAHSVCMSSDGIIISWNRYLCTLSTFTPNGILIVFHVMKLAEGQYITTFALNKDNTNLLVSTADKQLIIYTDPALSLKVLDHMLKLGWEGDGLSPLIN
ncbi:hypothetical protein F511_36242 [Dorcoceras hygrometricum]|uniref:BEACH domain-containing protein lvsC n=1 Tax=Dorcoceras hygrometricum TaxID=472368 RepID=A0A2Z7BUR3_9LAMI|nr:hypothetical protein F511_36242 [Dorcoceras hygrometricum]